MKYFSWNLEKNQTLIVERGISFEEIVFHIERGDILDLEGRPKSPLLAKIVRSSEMCFRKAAGVVPLLQGLTKVQIATHSQFAAEMDFPAGLLVEHPNKERYPAQRMFIVNIEGYAYLVPFVEDGTEVFLKTIIPCRKATRDYLGESS